MTLPDLDTLLSAPLSEQDETALAIQAAAFRRLVSHLRNRHDVQNIDMMNLAGFCRNCLSGWYQDAAADKGFDIDKDSAREIIYGMSYADWKAQFQTEATDAQKQAFELNHDEHNGDKS